MDIALNLTLLVQMGHFVLAYYLLKYLLLEPGYEVVAAERKRVKHLRNQIITRQELIAHKQAYKDSRWSLFQSSFAKSKPEFEVPSTALQERVQRTEEPLSSQEKETNVKAVVAALKKRMGP